MGVAFCVDTYLDMCTGMYIDMCMDICIVMCIGVEGGTVPAGASSADGR